MLAPIAPSMLVPVRRDADSERAETDSQGLPQDLSSGGWQPEEPPDE